MFTVYFTHVSEATSIGWKLKLGKLVELDDVTKCVGYIHFWLHSGFWLHRVWPFSLETDVVYITALNYTVHFVIIRLTMQSVAYLPHSCL